MLDERFLAAPAAQRARQLFLNRVGFLEERETVAEAFREAGVVLGMIDFIGGDAPEADLLVTTYDLGLGDFAAVLSGLDGLTVPLCAFKAGCLAIRPTDTGASEWETATDIAPFTLTFDHTLRGWPKTEVTMFGDIAGRRFRFRGSLTAEAGSMLATVSMRFARTEYPSDPPPRWADVALHPALSALDKGDGTSARGNVIHWSGGRATVKWDDPGVGPADLARAFLAVDKEKASWGKTA